MYRKRKIKHVYVNAKNDDDDEIEVMLQVPNGFTFIARPVASGIAYVCTEI